jgi:hypothetical protein
MARLDGLGREFSADLKARNEDSQLISKSTLAGGFIHLLCSLVTVTEAATTSRNGWEVENEYTAYNIAAHFKYILICRLQELVGEILNIFRFEDQGLELPHCHSDAYAAGVILRCEVEYFQNSIKNGHLRKHVSFPSKLQIQERRAFSDLYRFPTEFVHFSPDGSLQLNASLRIVSG